MSIHYSLKLKLITIGILLAVIPIVIAAFSTWTSGQQVEKSVSVNVKSLEGHALDLQAQNIFRMAMALDKILNQRLRILINVATKELKSYEGIYEDKENLITWEAMNQFTKRTDVLELPSMMLGNGTWLGKEKDPNRTVPFIDPLAELTDATATVFQRTNEQGDMLRVATNVMKTDQTRAIGTYIPAFSPNGKPNPVISKVMQGETFFGRAFVVNQWYVTAYRPLYDDLGRIIGIIYVGIPERLATQPVREAILNTTIGESGYVFVLNARGKDAGNYVISEKVR